MSIQITTKLQFNEHQARYPNFSYEELACQHCGSMDLPLEFLIALQELREAVAKPMQITSGYRCAEHPIEKVGKELRSKMKFLNSEKLVDKEKN